jgi:hypothetical protein
MDTIMEITKCRKINGDRADYVVGNQTGFWGARSFHLCQLRTDCYSSLLSC